MRYINELEADDAFLVRDGVLHDLDTDELLDAAWKRGIVTTEKSLESIKERMQSCVELKRRGIPAALVFFHNVVQNGDSGRKL